MADASEGKKLTELRVIDLKTELERRGLDKTGNKAALLERLAKAITGEGHNPDEYLIVPSVGLSKATLKKAVEQPTMVPQVEETSKAEDTKRVEVEEADKIEKVKETPMEINEVVEAEVEEDSNNDQQATNKKKSKDDTLVEKFNNSIDGAEELIINISAQPEDLNMECQDAEPEPETEETKEKIENKYTGSEDLSNVSAVETNGIDNEDSINLTIGEDEENLLAEESESNDRSKGKS
uniref:SAP domain-containing protein n=1 Tax=Trichogramma kaykai TaxID=54128 RepID=A0ABD2WWM6_9HYME